MLLCACDCAISVARRCRLRRFFPTIENAVMPLAEAPPIAFPRELDGVIENLRRARIDWRAAHDRHVEHGPRFPSRRALERVLRELGAALFPLRLGPPELTAQNENAFVAATLESVLSQLSAQIGIELRATFPGWIRRRGCTMHCPEKPRTAFRRN